MTDEPGLEPLPEDVAGALDVERTRSELPEDTHSQLLARIEATPAYAAATSSHSAAYPVIAVRWLLSRLRK